MHRHNGRPGRRPAGVTGDPPVSRTARAMVVVVFAVIALTGMAAVGGFLWWAFAGRG